VLIILVVCIPLKAIFGFLNYISIYPIEA